MIGERPTRDETCMEIARVFAQRSTCQRAQVGVVVAVEGRIVATGYNGAPRGLVHCEHTCVCGAGVTILSAEAHSVGCPGREPCRKAIHAEANAIAFAARYGVALFGGVLYSTLASCLACAQLIVNSGISRCVLDRPYRDRAGLELLVQAGIQVS